MAVDVSQGRTWTWAFRALTVAFLGTAALNILHVRGGFFTSYLADLTVPAWLYIHLRGLAGHHHVLHRYVGKTPEVTASVLFIATTATEFSQLWWPRGFFAGRFDVLDIAAYALGVGACYVADRLTARAEPSNAAAA